MGAEQLLETQYVWLRGRSYPQPEGYQLLENGAELMAYLGGVAEGALLFFDFETTGVKYWRHSEHIVGLGLWHAGAEKPAYIRLDTILYDNKGKLHKGRAKWLVQQLTAHKLAAYNLVFDGGFLYALNRQLGKKQQLPDEVVLDALTACPLTLFRMLANEGKQSHSLEMAQKNLLGWEDSQKDWLKNALDTLGLRKGDMYKLQEDVRFADGFARYCAADAAAAGLVWRQLVSECQRIGNVGPVQFHMAEGISQIRELIEQAYEGIKINLEKMHAFLLKQYKLTLSLEAQLRAHPLLSPHIMAWEQAKWAETFQMKITPKTRQIKDAEIVKLALEKAKADEELIAEFTEIDVYEDDNYKGNTKYTPAYMDGDGNVVQTRYALLLQGANQRPPHFNFASSDQREWLFYTAMGKAERIIDEFERDVFRYEYNGNTYYLPPTKKGNKPTGKEIFPVLGELGDLFKKYKKAQKLYEYAVSYYAAAKADKGRIHGTFNPSGTHTGRLSAGGGINLQQLPKVQEFLECFEADEGEWFFDFDFTALEKVVQAEFSKCPALKLLYASGETHDVHLFNTKAIHPDPAVREALAVTYRPDEAVLEELKKKHKGPRNLGKQVGFSLDYGAGVYKIFRNLRNSGFDVTYEATDAMVKSYKQLYRKVYEWGWKLQKEWDENGGVIEDALGFPVSVPEHYKHDCTSRFVQRSGHHMLMKANYNIARMRRATPQLERPAIQDLHDERIGRGRIEDKEAIFTMYQAAVELLNELLQPDIPFTISCACGPTLWSIKQ